MLGGVSRGVGGAGWASAWPLWLHASLCLVVNVRDEHNNMCNIVSVARPWCTGSDLILFIIKEPDTARRGTLAAPAPSLGHTSLTVIANSNLDGETVTGRCAAPSGRIWVISGSLTLSLVRLWTLATHMLTAGPTSLLIHALGSFTFRIRAVTQ